jgi:hypothetical protein
MDFGKKIPRGMLGTRKGIVVSSKEMLGHAGQAGRNGLHEVFLLLFKKRCI